MFRRHDAIPGVADEAIAVDAEVAWLQLGLRHDEAAREAVDAGLLVVQDKCLKIEHARFSGRLHLAGFNTGVVAPPATAPSDHPGDRGPLALDNGFYAFAPWGHGDLAG